MEYYGYIGFGLFLLSEILSLTKNTKSNGLLHSVVCFLKGSECVTKTVREQIEKELEKEPVQTSDVAIQTN
jgi:hypothetical protein